MVLFPFFRVQKCFSRLSRPELRLLERLDRDVAASTLTFTSIVENIKQRQENRKHSATPGHGLRVNPPFAVNLQSDLTQSDHAIVSAALVLTDLRRFPFGVPSLSASSKNSKERRSPRFFSWKQRSGVNPGSLVKIWNENSSDVLVRAFTLRTIACVEYESFSGVVPLIAFVSVFLSS